MSRPILIEPFSVRRRRRVNWAVIFAPVAVALLFLGAFYVVNEWRASADRAVDRWAKQVGVE